MHSIFTVVYALLALLSFHSLSANAQFQIYRDRTATVSAVPASPVTSRQFHPARSIIDTCAYVDANVLDLVDLKLCLCLSALPLAIEANAQLSGVAKLLGTSVVEDLLAKLVVNSAGKKQCSCPDHGHLVCAPGNPCNFECDPPYVRNGDKCVCAPPNMECNGKCGSFPHGCGSAVPYPRAFLDNSGRNIAPSSTRSTSPQPPSPGRTVPLPPPPPAHPNLHLASTSTPSPPNPTKPGSDANVWGAQLPRDEVEGRIRREVWEVVKPTAHIFYGTRMLDVRDGLGKWEGYEGVSEKISED
ncbi:hypothetical protein EIP91_008076 [Steccherinum ochraceum]|uniref:Uncharacterized protein n=1 Tax=Steccherinum ochraceum TaxID=92696 RepID=A0A4R0RKS7_9APHY|nr:hypothetical protein EIP91_008076 [Steccherinum ochraceum]